MAEILVRVVRSGRPGDLMDLSPSPYVARFADRAEDLGDAIQEIASTMRRQFDKVAESSRPGWEVDEIELSVSLDLEAEAGVILAKAKTTAGFDVSFRWKRAVRSEG